MGETGLANGLEYLLTRFVPLLRKIGISDEALDCVLVKNPSEVFAINV